MSNPSNRPPGRPVAPKVDPHAEERIEMAPTADHGGRVEGAPTPVMDVSKTEQVAAPAEKAAPKEKQWKWFKVQIDLGQSTDKIVVNEQEFHHGQIATVREDLLPVLNEVMFNTKMHERVVRGEVSPSGHRLQGRR